MKFLILLCLVTSRLSASAMGVFASDGIVAASNSVNPSYIRYVNTYSMNQSTTDILDTFDLGVSLNYKWYGINFGYKKIDTMPYNTVVNS